MSTGNIDDQQSWSNQFRQDFIRHSAAEELILFPAYEKYIKENNTEMIYESQRDHREVVFSSIELFDILYLLFR